MAKLLGIDVGSTTVKVCVLEEGGTALHTSYVRHFSRVKECVLCELEKIRHLSDRYRIAITGSAGLGLAQRGKLDFVQEVQAAYTAIKSFIRMRMPPWSWVARMRRSFSLRGALNSA